MIAPSSLPQIPTIYREYACCLSESPMPAPRLLVMEGNSPETRAQHVAAGGTVASQSYANLLQELLPSAVVDICFPGDPGANLPIGEALEGCDGVALTGSGL